jgi:hypothetical protein
MKTNKLGSYKKLALGIALASGVSGANAGNINPGAMAVNDVFLSVWDATKQTSFAADLGVDLTTFVGLAGANKAYDLGAAFTTWAALGAGDTFTYNVAGVNQVAPQNSTVDGVMLSGESTNLPWPAGSTPNYKVLGTITGIINQRVNDINVNGLGVIASVDSLGNPNQGYFNNVFWGASQGISSTAWDSSTVGDAASLNQLFVQYVHTTGIPVLANSSKMTLETLSGSFSLNTANSTLNWTTTAVTAVPVPAAVWLFMGGLMSVLGFQKRKSALAA